MQIISTADNKYSWALELYRSPNALTLQDAANFAKSLSADVGLAYLAVKGKQYISCCKSEDSIKLSDFGAAVTLWGGSKGLSNFIYLESQHVKNEILAVVVIDGIPVLDQFIEPNDLQILADNYSLAAEQVFVGGQWEPGTLNFENVEAVERLSFNLNPVPTELQPLHEVLKRNVSPFISWGTAGVGAIALLIAAFSFLSEPEPIATTNPYGSFYGFLENDSINVLNRVNQDYNEQIRLLALHGWQLKSVTHTRASVAYEVVSTSDGSKSSIGNIAALERYANHNNLTLLIEPAKRDGSAVLMAMASNITATADHRLYSVEQMFRTLKDAIELYIPDSNVEFVRDIGQSGSTWKLREVVVSFSEHDVRYLNTLGAIIEELPVSFGGDRTDLQIGKFTLSDNGLLTGSLKITLIGE